MTEFTVRPIGRVSTTRAGRIDDDWGRVESVIRLDGDRFAADSLAGLDEFSHVEVIFLFDRFDEAKVAVGARHPRGNEAWPKVGIFAQRASSRPNRLGLTTCEVLGVDGLDIRVLGWTRSTELRCSTSSLTCANSIRAVTSASRPGHRS